MMVAFSMHILEKGVDRTQPLEGSADQTQPLMGLSP